LSCSSLLLSAPACLERLSAAGSIAATWFYRRPRPVLKPPDPERQAKLDALLEGLPDAETAVFQDEVDINTNPKIGSMWMVKGRQAKVETPGNNEKRYLSGSIHWRTGQVFLTAGAPKQGRDTALFVGESRGVTGSNPRPTSFQAAQGHPSMDRKSLLALRF
jgi:hypothetical protein